MKMKGSDQLHFPLFIMRINRTEISCLMINIQFYITLYILSRPDSIVISVMKPILVPKAE